MKYTNKFIFVFVVMIMLLPSVFLSADAAIKEKTVSVSPSGGSGITIIDPATGNEKAPEITEVYDSQAWVIPKGERLYFDLDDNFAYKVDDGSVFDFEIEYCALQGVNGFWGMLNRDSNAFMELRYDSKITSTYTGGVFGTGQEGIERKGLPSIADWKTARMTVDNAYFDNVLESLNGEEDIPGGLGGAIRGDFWLAAKTAANWFSSALDSACYRDVYVRKITVTRHYAAKPVLVSAEFSEPGNTFEWYNEQKPVEITLENTLNDVKNVAVECTAKDQYGIVASVTKNEVTLTAKENKKITVNIDTDRCGIYTYGIKLSTSDNTVSSEFGPWRFAIVKTDPNGIRNEKAYLSTNMGRTADPETTRNTVRLASKSNAGGMRSDMPFDYLYYPDRPGEFIENWSYGDLVSALRDENMKLLNIVSLYRSGVDTISTPGEALLSPTHSDEAKVLADKYIKWLSEKYGDVTEYYEIWNEPEGVANDAGVRCIDADPEKYGQAYTDICNIFYSAIKKYSSAKVIGGTMWLATENDIAAVESEYKAGIDRYTDMIGWHPYSTDQLYEKAMPEFKTRIADVNEIKSKYSDRQLSFASTEAGATPMNVQGSYPHDLKYVQPCRNNYQQGNLNMRGYLEQISLGSEIWTTYVFTDPNRGTVTGESTYGITECAMKRSPTADGDSLIPKDAFLQETAKNYWLADAQYESTQVKDDNIYVMKFDSSKFSGKKIAVLWTVSGDEKVTLNLGVKSVTYSDGYGNEQQLSNSGGRYTLYACDRPVYLIGDFEDILIEQRVRKNSNFKITLSGIVKGCGANENLAITVMPDGIEPTKENTAEIVYVDQIKTGVQGRYEYNLTVQNPGEKLRVYIKSDKNEGQEFLLGQSENDPEASLFIKQTLEYTSPWYADPAWTYTDTYTYYNYAPYLYDLGKASYVFSDKSGKYMDTPLSVYCVLYKNGSLKKIIVQTAEEDLNGEVVLTPPEVSDSDYDSAAFFVWKDGGNIVPIGEPVRVER